MCEIKLKLPLFTDKKELITQIKEEVQVLISSLTFWFPQISLQFGIAMTTENSGLLVLMEHYFTAKYLSR